MWIYVAAPHHTTKPSWGGDAHAGLKRTPGFGQNKVPAKGWLLDQAAIFAAFKKAGAPVVLGPPKHRGWARYTHKPPHAYLMLI